MNTTRTSRSVAGIGAALLLATALAVPASAAVPPATAGGFAYGNNGTDTLTGTYGGDGYAGFRMTFQAGAGVNLAKLYFEADFDGGSSLPVLIVTRGATSANKDCFVQASPLSLKCQFKTVRNSDPITIDVGVAGAGSIATEGLWSTTGYVPGGNSSHGDAWSSGLMSSSKTANLDYSAGFGNRTLATEASTNQQAAKLLNLPAGKFASLLDNAGPDGFGFSVIEITVNDGALATFQLQITYPKTASPPKSYSHTSLNYGTETYLPCVKGKPQTSCFTFDKKSMTTTLYLLHNGSIRRSG